MNTTTTWQTTAAIPLGPWAQLVADVKVLLAAMAAAGAHVTGPDGVSGPELGDTRVSFIVTAADRSPMPVRFTREPHEGSVQSASPLTTGLVLVIVARAVKHWGQLVTTTSDADRTAWAVCEELYERLFGDADRAVNGGATSVESRGAQIAHRVRLAAEADQHPSLLDHLNAMIAGLTAERDGVAIANQFAPPPPPPAPAAPEPAPTDPATEEPAP